MKIFVFALAASMAASAFGQSRDDSAYADHVFSSFNARKADGHPEANGRVTFTPTPKPKQPTAKRDSAVDGAIVCPSLNETMWLYKKISTARIARTYMPPQAREMTILQDGYDPWEEPDPADYRCQFVPAGTPMNVKWAGGIPTVWGTTRDGLPFAGVTNPMMVDR